MISVRCLQIFLENREKEERRERERERERERVRDGWVSFQLQILSLFQQKDQLALNGLRKNGLQRKVLIISSWWKTSACFVQVELSQLLWFCVSFLLTSAWQLHTLSNTCIPSPLSQTSTWLKDLNTTICAYHRYLYCCDYGVRVSIYCPICMMQRDRTATDRKKKINAAGRDQLLADCVRFMSHHHCRQGVVFQPMRVSSMQCIWCSTIKLIKIIGG